MEGSFANGIRKPKWWDDDPKEWPSGMRVAYDVIFSAAERRMRAETQQKRGDDPSVA